MARKREKNICDVCCDDPCACTDHCGPASFSLGITFALVYLVVVFLAYLLPAFYSFLGFALFRGSLPVSVGDFSTTTIFAGFVGWFLIGVIINGVYFYAKKFFKYK